MYASSTLAPKYKPTLLVRVSDMQPVPGSNVQGQYWALSYSCNQSIFHTDNKNHKKSDPSQYIIVSRQQTSSKSIKRTVNLEKFIQQICIDFGIEYIWYDHLCLSQEQNNAVDVPQTRLVYSNACGTVALVPQLKEIANGKANLDIMLNCQWNKRLWNFHELHMSKKVLFVGRNVYFWADRI